MPQQLQQQPQEQQNSGNGSTFPLKEILLTTGLLSVAGMFYFYRKKQTLPFKACYGLMWPTLGAGTILAVTPSPEQMAQRLEQSRSVTTNDLQKQREANAATIDAMLKKYGQKQT